MAVSSGTPAVDRRVRFTPAVQRRFLAHLAHTSNILAAAKHAGIKTDTVLRKRHKDPGFAEKVAEAQALGEQRVLARLEREVDRRSLAGIEDRMSAILLMFRVKRLDPRYRDNAQVALNLQGPVAIALGLEPEGGPLPVGGGQAPPRPLAAFSREST